MVRSALAFPSGEGGERSETEEGYKVGIIDGLVEKFCCQTLDSRKLSVLVTLFRPRSSGTFPGGEGFFSLSPTNSYLSFRLLPKASGAAGAAPEWSFYVFTLSV